MSKRVRFSKVSVVCSIRGRLRTLFSVQDVRMRIVRSGFINAVALPLCHVHHVQHCVSRVFGSAEVGYAMALSWGLLSVLILGMAKKPGWILQKRTI
ncbi:MAG: hypothetical protein ACXV3D_08560 [Halobacteriota archaeon]